MQERILTTESKIVLEVGQLYFFNPSLSYSRLVMLKNPSIKSPCVCVIRRKSLLVVLGSDNSWRQVGCAGFEGWINVSNIDSESKTFTKTNKLQRYEDWKGNNHIMCNGKVIMGSDRGFFVFSNAVIVIPTILYLVLVVPKMPNYWIHMVNVISHNIRCTNIENTIFRQSPWFCSSIATSICGARPSPSQVLYLECHRMCR